jgi:hypothetical protein
MKIARITKNRGAMVPDPAGNTVANVPHIDDVLQIAGYLSIYIGWSIFWDKRYGVWRASEDDPSSRLYEENADARNVIAYVVAHS